IMPDFLTRTVPVPGSCRRQHRRAQEQDLQQILQRERPAYNANVHISANIDTAASCSPKGYVSSIPSKLFSASNVTPARLLGLLPESRLVVMAGMFRMRACT